RPRGFPRLRPDGRAHARPLRTDPMTRVLRLYHSAVVPEYRERERLLRERHGWDVHVACPPSWPEGGSVVVAEPDPSVPVHVLPVHGPTHPILFWYARGPLRRLIRELRPEIVDVHEEPYSLAALGAIRATPPEDRKSTRLNSSHQIISYAVF